MIWVYVGLALLCAVGVTFFAWLLRNDVANGMVDSWVYMLAGVCFLIVYEFESRRNPFLVAAGLTCIGIGAILLMVIGRKLRRNNNSQGALP